MALVKDFPFHRTKEAFKKHWRNSAKVLGLLPWVFSLMILLMIGQKINMFCHSEVFRLKSEEDKTTSIIIACICCLILMLLPFSNNIAHSATIYKSLSNHITGALLIASVVQLEAVFGRKQSLITVYFLMIVCRTIYCRSFYDNFSLCVAFTADFGAIGHGNSAWYIRANMFIWTYFLLFSLFQSMLGRYILRIWQHVRYLIIMKEKTKRQKLEQQSLISAHLDDDIVDHIFSRRVEHDSLNENEKHTGTAPSCPCHNGDVFLKKHDTVFGNSNVHDTCTNDGSPMISQAFEHRIICKFDPGDLKLNDLKRLDGLDRRSSVLIAIRVDKSNASDCALLLDIEHNFHHLLDMFASKYHITCVRKFGNVWIGTLGFFQTHHADFEHCYQALLFCCEMEYIAHKAGLNVAIALDHGTIIGGFLNSPHFDLFGQEVRWLMRMIDLKDYTAIIISDMIKVQTNIYKKQYPEAMVITTAKKAIEFPWKKDFVVTVQTVTNSYELRNFATIEKHINELGFENVHHIIDYLMVEPWKRINTNLTYKYAIPQTSSQNVDIVHSNRGDTSSSTNFGPQKMSMSYIEAIAASWYDGFGSEFGVSIWERLQFSLEDDCIQSYSPEDLVNLHEEMENTICHLVVNEYYFRKSRYWKWCQNFFNNFVKLFDGTALKELLKYDAKHPFILEKFHENRDLSWYLSLSGDRLHSGQNDANMNTVKLTMRQQSKKTKKLKTDADADREAFYASVQYLSPIEFYFSYRWVDYWRREIGKTHPFYWSIFYMLYFHGIVQSYFDNMRSSRIVPASGEEESNFSTNKRKIEVDEEVSFFSPRRETEIFTNNLPDDQTKAAVANLGRFKDNFETNSGRKVAQNFIKKFINNSNLPFQNTTANAAKDGGNAVVLSKRILPKTSSWNEYLHNSRSFFLNTMANLLMDILLLCGSFYAISYLIPDSTNLTSGLVISNMAIFAIASKNIHPDYTILGNYAFLWMMLIFLYAVIPCEFIARYSSFSIGNVDSYGDFGGNIVYNLFALFRIPVYIGQLPIMTFVEYVASAVITGAHYNFRPECRFTFSAYVDVMAVSITIMLWCVLYQYYVFVSYVVETKLVPRCDEEYRLSAGYTKELFDLFNPQLTSSFFPTNQQSEEKEHHFSLKCLGNLHIQQYYHHLGILSLHIKAADTISSLLDHKEFGSIMMALDQMFQQCFVDYRMLPVAKFSGVYVAITNPFSNISTDQFTSSSVSRMKKSLASKKQTCGELVLLLKHIQEKLEKFNQNNKVNIIVGMSINYGSAYVGFLGNIKCSLDAVSYDRDMSVAMASYHVPEGIFVSYHCETELSKIVSSPESMIQRQMILQEHDTISVTPNQSLYVSNYWLKLNGKLSGIQLDDFAYVGMLGKGGYGSVHLVCEKRSNLRYAIKVIVLRPGMSQMIKRECIILQKMQHPNLVNLKYSFITNNRLYLVMSYIPGGTLKQVIDRDDEHIDFSQLKIWFAELLLALEYVHRMGIIHRDVKPANCMISTDGHLKLADFGLAKSIPNALQEYKSKNSSRSLQHEATGKLMTQKSSNKVHITGSMHRFSEVQLASDISKKLQKFLPLKASKSRDETITTSSNKSSTSATEHWQVTALFIQSNPSPVSSVLNSSASSGSNSDNGGNGVGSNSGNSNNGGTGNIVSDEPQVETHVLSFSNFSLQYYIVKNRQEAEIFLQKHNVDSIFIDISLSVPLGINKSSPPNTLSPTSSSSHSAVASIPSVTPSSINPTAARTSEMLYWLNMMEILTSNIYSSIPIYIFNIPGDEEHIGQYFVESGAKKFYTSPLASVNEDILRQIYHIGYPDEINDNYDETDEIDDNVLETPIVSTSSQARSGNGMAKVHKRSGWQQDSTQINGNSESHSFVEEGPIDGDNTTSSRTTSDTSHPHQIVGTMYFIAPEILRYHYYDVGVDWWAYGITVYYCTMKKYLFQGEDKKMVFQNILTQPIDVAGLSKFDPNIQSLVEGLLTREYEHRLGCHPVSGMAQLKNHSFFQEIDWKSISYNNKYHHKPSPCSYKKYDMKDKLLFYGELESQLGKKLLTTNIQAMEMRNHYAITKYKQTRKRLKEVKKGYIRKSASATGHNSASSIVPNAAAANLPRTANPAAVNSNNGHNSNWFSYDPVLEETNEEDEEEKDINADEMHQIVSGGGVSRDETVHTGSLNQEEDESKVVSENSSMTMIEDVEEDNSLSIFADKSLK